MRFVRSVKITFVTVAASLLAGALFLCLASRDTARSVPPAVTSSAGLNGNNVRVAAPLPQHSFARPARAELANTFAGTVDRATYATAWATTDRTEFAAFRNWTARYVASANSPRRAALEREGVALAHARRVALRDMIEQDPQLALTLTVPATVRGQLPAAVVAELETRVTGTGNLEVLPVEPVPGSAVASDSIERIAYVNGESYDAHVYGRRLEQLTKEGASLNGVALDGQLALSESPLRVLDAGEIPARSIEPVNPVAAAAGLRPAIGSSVNTGEPTVVEAHGRLWQLADSTAIGAFEAQLIAAENQPGPAVAAQPTGTGSSDTVEAGTVSTAWSTGTKRVLIIRVDFADVAGEPVNANTGKAFSLQDWTDLMTNQVAPYYADASFGKTTMVPTITSTVYRLPQTAASYAQANSLMQLHADAVAAASAAYKAADYDLITVAFSRLDASAIANSQFYFAGLASIGGTKAWINGYFSFATLAHELGHNYGLAHANLWQISDGNPVSATGQAVEYGDVFDIMGGGGDRTHHFNQLYKSQLGWIPDSAVADVTQSGTFRLYRCDLPAATFDHPLALRILRVGTQSYWLAYRKPAAIANHTITDGLYACWQTGSLGSQSLDLTPATDDLDVALPVGSALRDTAYGITVNAVAHGGSGISEYLDVSVAINRPATPVRGWGSGLLPNIPGSLVAVRDIAAGGGAGLAVQSDGSVIGWGNGYSSGTASVPAGLTGVVAVSASASGAAAALKSDGSAVFWSRGANPLAQPPADFPTRVQQLSLGWAHGIALRTDGTVYTWGANDVGQCSIPSGLTDVIAVAAGHEASYALKADGTVAGWGQYYAAAPQDLRDVVAIAAGDAHVLALKRDGTIVTWGVLNGIWSSMPANLANVRAIYAAGNASYAQKANGEVVAWGVDNYGNPLAAVPAGMPVITKMAPDWNAALALVGANVPTVTVQSHDRAVDRRATATFTVFAVSSSAATYRWQWRASASGIWNDMQDGADWSGTATETLSVGSGSPATSGAQFRCVVTNAAGATTGALSTLSLTGTVTSTPTTGDAATSVPANRNRLINLSTRSFVGTDGNIQIAGFVIRGDQPKKVIIRASGPSLAQFGVTGVLADPVLQLYSGQSVIYQNDNWDAALASEFSRVGAYAWSAGSKDAALAVTLQPGAYSALVSGKNGGTGVALIEVYDADNDVPPAKLINLSTRSFVGTDGDIQIAGFVIQGDTPKKVVIRASGPSLAQFGVTGVLADPVLQLYAGQSMIYQNDNWDASLAPDFSNVGGFAWNAGSKDAALVVTLQPGAYSALVSGKNGGTGVALIEVYEEN